MEKDWKKLELRNGHGIITVSVESFAEFISYIDYVHIATKVNKQYVWRGQRTDSWKLLTSLDRSLFNAINGQIQHEFALQYLRVDGHTRIHRLSMYENQHSKMTSAFNDINLAEYLNDFKLSVRGRRGPNPPPLETANDWWALGQHHGLRSPLLDWSASPYVAFFFGFEEETKSQTGKRVVYGLWEEEISTINNDITEEFRKRRFKNIRVPIIEFVRPKSNENPRLVAQRGLFTRAPLGIDIEEWLRISLPEDYNFDVLLKILIPDDIRIESLRALNRMNINHLSLFPDLIGASKYCNMTLDDSGYKGG